MNNAVVYDYKGSQISFMSGENVMVNATQMAKPFGKLVGDWLRLKTTTEFTEALATDMQIPISTLIQTVKGGKSEQGTWMHEDAALEFARWLSPAFAIWCNKRIKELLKTGVTTVSNDDEAIAYAMQVLNRRLEQAKAEKQRHRFSLIEIPRMSAFECDYKPIEGVACMKVIRAFRDFARSGFEDEEEFVKKLIRISNMLN